MIDFSELALETFQVLRAYGKEIVIYDENGNRVFEPADARRFYLTDDNILVSVLEDGDNSAIKVYLSGEVSIAEMMEFITVLRRIATQFNVLFNVRKYNKQITPRDFATQAAVQEQKEYSSMNIMEGLYGTSKSSYLKLENARMIVRHSARVNENMIGGRGRSIQSIFVENAQGERFLFPVNVLSGARAMTQHVNQGGTFADEVGQQIIRMAQDFSNLSATANHVYAHQKSLPGQALQVRESIRQSVLGLRRTFERLCRDDASYIRESARITTAEALTESPDTLVETVEALRALITVEGIEIAESVLATVAKYVDESVFAEDMRPDTNPQDDTEEPKSGAPVAPEKPLAPGETEDDQDDETNGQSGSFHEDEDMDSMDDLDEDESDDEEDSDDLAENNSVIQAFNAWMEDFDADTMFEGKSFKRNKDEDADDKKAEDKKRRQERENKKEQPVEEGKSFKRNDDDEADVNAKKKQDKEKRDAQKGKTERTDESLLTEGHDDEEAQYMLADQTPDVFGSAAAYVKHRLNNNMANVSSAMLSRLLFIFFKKRVDLNDLHPSEHVIHDYVSTTALSRVAQILGITLTEGKSFKRNDDDEGDVVQKRKDDKERRSQRKNDEEETVEEGKSFKRNDDDSQSKKEKDEERRKAREDKNKPVEEGKSFKRNDDEEVQSKKEKDEERRKAREEKNRTDEAFEPGQMVDITSGKHAGKSGMITGGSIAGSSYKIKPIGGMDNYIFAMPNEVALKGQTTSAPVMDEAVEQTFEVYGVAGMKSKPFRKSFKTKAALDAFLEKNEGNIEVHGMAFPDGYEEVDEASDIGFQDAKREMPAIKQKLKGMNAFHPEYKQTKMRHDKLQDRLARNGSDDELDEAPLQVGDHIAYTFAQSSPPAVYNGTITAMKGDKIKIEWDAANGPRSGHYAGPSQRDYDANGVQGGIYNLHNARKLDAEVDEGMVDQAGDKAYTVIADGRTEKIFGTLDYVVTVAKKMSDGSIIPKASSVQVVDAQTNKPVWSNATGESYVSGDGGYGGDSSDVIEDMNMEDFVVPRNMSNSLASEVETKDKDGKPKDQAYVSRLRTLAGMNKI